VPGCSRGLPEYHLGCVPLAASGATGLGIIFFGVIIAGLVVNTIFIVREIRRNERQDSFLNAVTTN